MTLQVPALTLWQCLCRGCPRIAQGCAQAFSSAPANQPFRQRGRLCKVRFHERSVSDVAFLWPDRLVVDVGLGISCLQLYRSGVTLLSYACCSRYRTGRCLKKQYIGGKEDLSYLWPVPVKARQCQAVTHWWGTALGDYLAGEVPIPKENRNSRTEQCRTFDSILFFN